ncbi:hypothetical protein NC652_010538 [Populus alba x Populus x berolinensis]|uniref:Uncharacterized protein n=1 Tax=Populus alba x Populus x berolinensis TaxID=444605 RepID=A0AAD6R0H2_9ROSI|nr:hypothetical protein NC652_010538 [Populus alba x Populus x berolinensis]KAJ6999853.1 hypothetical protein NC653_010567 [Populus alba x Populus x berolinensis]
MYGDRSELTIRSAWLSVSFELCHGSLSVLGGSFLASSEKYLHLKNTSLQGHTIEALRLHSDATSNPTLW